MSILVVLAAAGVIAWVVMVFVLQIASGWVHVPLVLAVLLLVKAIADQPPIKSPSSKT